MLALSATDVAIRIAREAGTLQVTQRVDRFGNDYWAISDDRGLIEVASTKAEAEARTAA